MHPSGYEVEARSESIAAVLRRLQPLWPRGLRLDEAFADLAGVIDDVQLLHRNGMIQIHLVDLDHFASDPGPLHGLERDRGGFTTSRRHDVEFCG
jgi:hypothetical protein